MVRTAVLLVLGSSLVFGDERTQRLANRLAEEASAFQQIAPQVWGSETLEQRALKQQGKFRIRVGKAANSAGPEFQTRKIVSQYGFTTFASDGSLHELRQVTSVDGKLVKNKGPEALARIILASDDSRKRELLEQFQAYGLLGAATDFGPLLMLFTPASIVRYEFSYLREATVDNTPVLVFRYEQIDGPNPMTVIDEKGKSQSLAIRGEVWVRADYLPLRVTLISVADDVRQEAAVDYSLSRFGTLLPASTHHRELHAGNVTSENTFTYSDFQRVADRVEKGSK
jgi:hypothetical protein